MDGVKTAYSERSISVDILIEDRQFLFVQIRDRQLVLYFRSYKI